MAGNLTQKFLIGSIGRLAYPKNYEFLIKTVPEILQIRDDACCLIIGDGPEKEKYLSLIKKLGLEKHVYLAGELQDAYQYLPAFDIFALPSWYEGLSITLIEALFAGLPILASRVGGNPELLDFCEDQLFVLNDQEDFLDKFAKIARDSQLRARLASQNRENANRFLLSRATADYLHVYREANSLQRIREAPQPEIARTS